MRLLLLLPQDSQSPACPGTAAAAGHVVQPHHLRRGLLCAVVLPALLKRPLHTAAVCTGQLWLQRARVHGERLITYLVHQGHMYDG
jgi:hypothetical protein